MDITSTGDVRIVIQDPPMASNAPAPALGINGLHVHSGDLYFTNSELGTFTRMRLNIQGRRVSQAGATQVLGVVQPSGGEYDDFVIDHKGRAWVTTHPATLTLLYETDNGTWAQETAAGDAEGNSTVFIQPTSAAFGRRSLAEEDIL
ncbi:hypothetical protein DFH07DRAFT_954549 [Mycena maculata]|uniref:SMP-30/Gluconolactonase/LRE-like region domain-containing protein n=1 Tax=Mycena maculata TaxID=230809 RepID=A0AAD7NNT6_9AGAR|nr:hypothetical protein DFH07DRAFT_954549 [Mycena maculata]